MLVSFLMWFGGVHVAGACDQLDIMPVNMEGMGA